MRRAGPLAALALIGLASCAPYPLTPAAPPAPAPSAPAPAPSAPAPSATAPAPTPAPPPRSPIPSPEVSVRDPCGAEAAKALIGRPRTEIPVPLDPNRQRVACTTCPVTQDYNPARLNFFFDSATGLVREVRCG